MKYRYRPGRGRDQHVVAPACFELVQRQELRPATVPLVLLDELEEMVMERRQAAGVSASARSCRGTRSTDSRAP